MKTSLTAGVEPLQAREIELEYMGSQTFRRRLVELLIDRQESMLNKRRGETTYESPNWALLQADAVGYERAMNEVISLLK